MPSPSTIAAIAVLAFVTALAGCKPAPNVADTDAVGAGQPQVGIITLRRQAVVIIAELPGRVVAAQTAEVRPQVSGIIQRRLFSEGSEVAEGAPLYQLDPAPYKATYDGAVAALQKAAASLPSAQAKAERYQGLVKQSAVSKQDVDDANAVLAQAKADVETARVAVDAARINLDYTTIKAPIAGWTERSSLTVGALVTAGQPGLLTTIRSLDPILVDVVQSSSNLLNLRQAIDSGGLDGTGPHIAVKLKLENGKTYPLPGKLELSEANVSATTGTVILRAIFPNPQRLLLPGMYVRALVEEGVAPNGFLVPQRSIAYNAKGEAVAMFLDKDGVVEVRVLTVVRSVGHNWLIGSGVHDGDRVIVEGVQSVRPGQKAAGSEMVVDEPTGEILGSRPPQRRVARPRGEP